MERIVRSVVRISERSLRSNRKEVLQIEITSFVGYSGTIKAHGENKLSSKEDKVLRKNYLLSQC